MVQKLHGSNRSVRQVYYTRFPLANNHPNHDKFQQTRTVSGLSGKKLAHYQP